MKILKVVYIAFAAIIAVIVGLGVYYSYTYDYILEVTSKLVAEKDCRRLAEMYAYWFEGQDIAPAENCDDYNISIMRGGVIKKYSWYETVDSEEKQNTSENVYDCYYIYISNIQFDKTNCSIGDSQINGSGVRFYTTADETYDYLFEISDKVNTSHYKAKPATELECSKSQHGLFTNYDSWHFIDFDLTTLDVEAMNLTAPINGLAVIDNAGELVGEKLSINLDFNGDFFTKFAPFVTKYNSYIEESKNENNRESANKAFSEFYDGEDGFLADFKAQGYGVNTYANPGFLVWKSIGTAALFLVAAALLYILIFHFKWLKSLFFKNSNNGRYRVSNKQIAELEAKRKESIKIQPKEIKPQPAPKPVEKVEEEKKEPVKEEVAVEANSDANEAPEAEETKEDNSSNE